MTLYFRRALDRCLILGSLVLMAGCGGATPISGAGSGVVGPEGSGGGTMSIQTPDGGGSPGAGGAVARGTGGRGGGTGGAGGAAACTAGATCTAGSGCDQTCRMGGRAGLIACFCGNNRRLTCGMCVPGALPTCAPGVAANGACTVGMSADCETPCANAARERCTCTPPGRGGRGGGDIWMCMNSPAGCQ